MNNNRIQVEILLGTIAIIVSSILLVVVGFREETKLQESEVVQIAESIEFGASLYSDNCARCHGQNGEGLIGPPLNDEYFFTQRIKEVGWGGTLRDYIISTVSSGRPISTRPEQWPGEGVGYAMPSWAQDYGGPLRADQIRAIAAYILNWEATAIGEVGQLEILTLPGPVSADPVLRGRAVFNNKGCVACHTIQGVSVGAVGPELTNVATVAETRIDGQTAEEYITNSILAPSDHIVEECPTGPCASPSAMPANFGELLSETELTDLVAYLLSLK
ncbi:MAG: c-type cytochrome [Anaerolineales bacterium]|jgi:mono/diheme cytochrome c family protein|nr:c-type cytochrome [Anaerolineales bacterium]